MQCLEFIFHAINQLIFLTFHFMLLVDRILIEFQFIYFICEFRSLLAVIFYFPIPFQEL